MNNLVKLALIKQLGDEVGNFKAPVGSHIVDEIVTLKISGTVNKGADGFTTPTVDIPLKLALALFLERSGFQREGMMDLLVASMTEAIEAKEKGEEFVAEKIKDIELATQRVKDMLGKLPKKPKSGPTTIKVQVEELEYCPA